MEVGVDSFAAALEGDNATSMQQLLDRIEQADAVGLDVFGIGQHFRKEFLDSAPEMILSAAAARTKNIILTSAVSVLSAADPVRLFQQFATLDLISQGRAEIVAGRGSFTEAFPLFGLNLEDYDALFIEKLELLLQLRKQETVNWTGRFRAPLREQPVYPRPAQEVLPVWLGVGGTPASFARAGTLGLPLMVAVIGGETHRFRPLIDMYRQAWNEAGHNPDEMKVGLHSLGYVAETTQQAVEEYYPGYAKMFTRIGKERGWPPVTREKFDYLAGPTGAIVVGDAAQVAEKIMRHSEALGGVDRFTFQMDNEGLTHQQLLQAITHIGQHVKPLLS